MQMVPHALIEQAIYALAEQEGSRFEKRIKEQLTSFEDGAELRHAVLTLVSLAKRLDEAGNAEAADRILDLTSAAIEPLQRFGADARKLAEDLTRMKTSRFRAFAADEEKKRAPKYGVAQPTGTVSLKTLIPPRPRRA